MEKQSERCPVCGQDHARDGRDHGGEFDYDLAVRVVLERLRGAKGVEHGIAQ